MSESTVMAEFEGQELIMVLFLNGGPFQVFTKKDATVYMYDLNDPMFSRSKNWSMSGAGLSDDGLYLEGTGAYWVADGFTVKGSRGSVKLKTLPKQMNRIDQIFKREAKSE